MGSWKRVRGRLGSLTPWPSPLHSSLHALALTLTLGACMYVLHSASSPSLSPSFTFMSKCQEKYTTVVYLYSIFLILQPNTSSVYSHANPVHAPKRFILFRILDSPFALLNLTFSHVLHPTVTPLIHLHSSRHSSLSQAVLNSPIT